MTNPFRQEILGADGQGNDPPAVNAFDLFIENNNHSQANTRSSKDCVIGDAEIISKADALGSMKDKSYDENKIMPPGSAIERLEKYLDYDIRRVYFGNNGNLTRAELNHRLSTNNSSEDEVKLLTWMSKNMLTIEQLGDKWAGFSKEDMESLKQLEKHGTSSPAFALRDKDWLSSSVGSTVLGFVWEAMIKSLLKAPLSIKDALIRSACIFGAVTLADAYRYYFDDKPKIDNALKELNELNTVSKPQT